MRQVPIIDIAGFETGRAAVRRAIAQQVDRAARGVGFMQVTGHDVPYSAIEGLTRAMDGFFGLSLEEKLACRPPSAVVNRGYSSPGSERLSYSLGVATPADLFEAFNIGAAASDFPGFDLPLESYPENIWPVRPPDFQDGVLGWFGHAGALARRLTRIFAVALDLPEDYFAAFQERSIDVLRLNNYQAPRGGVALEPGQMGMGGHTDFGIVTVLWADPVTPGLQIQDGQGAWHDVVPAPGALLVNLGDMLARWTNDRWVSTMHRVAPSIDAQGRAIRRRSAAYFHDGAADAVVSCLPTCADADRPPLYGPVTVAQHIAAKLAGSRGLTLNPTASREAERLRR